ncbi:hypothetical protein KPL74_16535 [Bacillus sp. NP157]|nr:hypothetical protein KPL74_16535 [Bacillus sp. NP157]
MPHVVAWMSIALVIATGTTLLVLQLRAYRLTRHRSLLVAAASQVAGLGYAGMVAVLDLRQATAATQWTIYYSAHALLLVQCVVGVIGAAWLFRAFVSLSAR